MSCSTASGFPSTVSTTGRLVSLSCFILWIGCGTEDPGYNGVKGMDDLLTTKRVKHVWNESGGGHSWPNWQVYLSKYAPLLFRN